MNPANGARFGGLPSHGHACRGGDGTDDGKPQPVNIRVTTTFRKEGGQWKVIGHHTDMLPFLQK